MIEFTCDKCRQKLQMAEKDAGKKCRCPECKVILIVPEQVLFEFETDSSGKISPIPFQTDESNTNRNINSALDLKPKPVMSETNPSFDETEGQPYSEEYPDEKNTREDTNKPRRPVLAAIFLYPTSIHGLSIIAVIVGIPFLINIFAMLAGPIWGIFIIIPGFFVIAVLAGYTFWYFCQCIRESADGQTKAPDVLVNAPALGDIGWQFLQTAVSIAFFAAPGIIYYRYTGKTDITFFLLLAYAALFLPMGLLAVVLYDAISALNPLLLIGSVLKTFLSYIKLVVLFYIVGCLLFFVSRLSLFCLFDVIVEAISVYLLLILAHLLGRFYRTNSKKLGWDI